MQELWLFGQLKTLEANDTQTKMNEDANAVAELLKQLTQMSGMVGPNGES